MPARIEETVLHKFPHILLYPGIFLLSFSLLAAEILLTRFLSVVFYYHFAFLVVSVALFGLTVGALLVHLFPRYFSEALTYRRLAFFTYLSSILMAISFILLFYLPIFFYLRHLMFLLMPALYISLSLPFVAFGVVLSLVFARFPRHIDRIYCSNLVGSALGCVGIIFILNIYKNGVAAVLFLSYLCVLAAGCFSYYSRPKRLTQIFLILSAAGFLGLSGWVGAVNGFRPLWAKSAFRPIPPVYERWNYFSAVTLEVPPRRPFGWGFSPKIRSSRINTGEMMIALDYDAGTVLTSFDNLSDLEYLKLDVTAMAHYLRVSDDVAVVGSGGGRDLLTALLFGAKKIYGIEINPDINDIAFNKFRDFSGGILRFPQIHFIVDDGRSFILKSKEKFNIIQASLIDSFAATFSGAFALTENSLYTQEAWVAFLSHLKDNGILTFSHFYFENAPLNMYRFVALAKASLESLGVENPRDHIILVRQKELRQGVTGIGTILVSRSPFSGEEVAKLEKICQDLRFDIILSPGKARDKNFLKILSAPTSRSLLNDFPFNITAPTDNRPFYFYFAKFSELFSTKTSYQGALLLRRLFLVIFLFGAVFILLPVIFHFRRHSLAQISGPWLLYFLALGLGFMFIEISFMQRLGIFLGHPIYGLTVVLFSLLFFSGVGSFLSRYIDTKAKVFIIFFLLIVLALKEAFFLPLMAAGTSTSSMSMKIASAAVAVALLGVFMGMPFPLGIKKLQDQPAALVVYWGVNGFASVSGSCLATVSLIYFGFQKTLCMGSLCYFLALLAFLLGSRNLSGHHS